MQRLQNESSQAPNNYWKKLSFSSKIHPLFLFQWMKNMFRQAMFFLSLVFMQVQAAEVNAPIAEKIPTKLTKHKDTRIDNYFWMKDKKNPKVIEHLKAENAYTEDVMKDSKDLQDKLYTEMRSRVKEDDQSVPYLERNYFYFTRNFQGKEYPVYYRQKNALGAKEEQLLDVNEMAKGLDFIYVSFPDFYNDEKTYAYAVDTKGDRVFTIYFKDAETGNLLSQKIEGVTGNYVWAETGKVLFYTKHDPVTLRSDKVYRYELESNKSTLVYTEKDEKFEASIGKTLSRDYVYIYNGSTLSSEVMLLSSKDPFGKFKLFSPRKKDQLYSVLDGGDRFYILTNWKAKNFRLMETAVKETAQKNWKDVIAHRPDVFIEEASVFKNYIVLSERSNGLTQINVIKRGENKGTYINFPDPAYSVYSAMNPEYDSNIFRYGFISMNRPTSFYDFNCETKQSKLLKEKEVPKYDSSQYVSERVFATAKDGVRIPISLVYKKGFKKDGTNPLLVYGYGSYGMSSDPYFASGRVSLLDRGFVYAIIHIRGGAEMGRAWYEDGKFLKKKNTFTDFIAGTEYLLNEKYGNPKKVFANGGSAGGLLMGAVINLRPDLYTGIVAEVPFVDVVTTMLDSSLPLTTGEYEEWGNPNDKKYYEYMKSYSPYDNVKPMDYPNLFVTTGLNDSQVSFWEPTKWVSKIRDMRTDKSKILMMKIEMDVGHGGKSGRFEYLRDEALQYVFYLNLAGIKQ